MNDGNIAVLRPAERVGFDVEPLRALVRDLGADPAERAADDVIEDIILRLSAVETAWAQGDFPRLTEAARMLGTSAERLGMVTVSRVAQGLRGVGRTGDSAAMGALLARLARVCEASLFSIWDIGYGEV